MYRPAIQDGLDKLKKYYVKFDKKPAYILALSNYFGFSLSAVSNRGMVLVLHPYYKLDYITMAWGGEREQAREREAGNENQKNWQDIALEMFEKTVCSI